MATDNVPELMEWLLQALTAATNIDPEDVPAIEMALLLAASRDRMPGAGSELVIYTGADLVASSKLAPSLAAADSRKPAPSLASQWIAMVHPTAPATTAAASTLPATAAATDLASSLPGAGSQAPAALDLTYSELATQLRSIVEYLARQFLITDATYQTAARTLIDKCVELLAALRMATDRQLAADMENIALHEKLASAGSQAPAASELRIENDRRALGQLVKVASYLADKWGMSDFPTLAAGELLIAKCEALRGELASTTAKLEHSTSNATYTASQLAVIRATLDRALQLDRKLAGISADLPLALQFQHYIAWLDNDRQQANASAMASDQQLKRLASFKPAFPFPVYTRTALDPTETTAGSILAYVRSLEYALKQHQALAAAAALSELPDQEISIP
jgi:hypothetical protein